MAMVVFLRKDEDVLSVYRNLKIFCETAPWYVNGEAAERQTTGR